MAGKIFVTSATGNVGGEIVRLLKEKMPISSLPQAVGQLMVSIL